MILSVVNYSETDLIVQALGRMDSSRKENFENKKMVEVNAKGNTSGYRASNQQSLTESSDVNNIRNDGFGRSFRPPRNNSRPEKQNEHDRNRDGINQNWRNGASVNFPIPDTSRPPPNTMNNQVENRHNKQNPASGGGIRTLRRSEFIDDLWM